MASKILVVDDEAEIVKALQLRLEASGYEVTSAFDGTGALRKLRAEKPDLVILDVLLPDIDGFRVCETIKSDPATRDVPVIMLTAKNMGEDVEKALQKKADWYVTKPYDYAYLLTKIDKFLRRG